MSRPVSTFLLVGVVLVIVYLLRRKPVSAVAAAPSASLGAVLGRNTGVRIATAAEAAVGAPNTAYYPKPRVACASAVSQWLIRAGLPEWIACARAPILQSNVQRAGAAPVSGNLQPGDVLFFSGASGKTKHTGVYVGGGQMVDTSSGAGVVKQRPISAPGYDYFSAYRFFGGGQ